MAKLSEIAVWYGKKGFSVVPLNGKRALTRWGRENREYFRKEDEIDYAFSQIYSYKDRVTGEIVTTAPTGIGLILEPSETVVLDLDSEQAIEWARQQAKREPSPYRSATQIKSPREGGGLHLYFRQNPHRAPLRQCHGGLHPQVDLKASGSLVVAAGSLHKTGRRYEFKTPKQHFSSRELPIAPNHLYDWQDEKDRGVEKWDQNITNHSGFEGTILYHHVQVYSGGNNKLHIRCPNYQSHSKNDVSGTVLYPANKLGGLGKIHCEHAACSGMTAKDYKMLVGHRECDETEKRILGK